MSDSNETPLQKRLRSSFSRQTLMKTFHAQMVTAEPGHVEIEAPILPGAQQQHGFAHAGLTFSLGDSAAGYAGLSILPDGAEVLTAEMKINLLAPGKGRQLRATGRVIKPGRRLVVVAADVHAIEDDAPVLIAILQGTLIPLMP